ncbi:hypothetical protein [uncultured Jannaschia sp.]|nr:hypothetical protein [uncultured Jannaschia sp.]
MPRSAGVALDMMRSGADRTEPRYRIDRAVLAADADTSAKSETDGGGLGN